MRLLPLLLCGLFLLAAGSAHGSPPRETTAPEPLPGVKVAEAVSATTGVAISPLLGVATLGAWQYWHAPAATRASVPWHAKPWFWGPALALVLLLAAKEPLLCLLPGAKKPLDLLELIENKASALVAAPVVVHLALQAFQAPANTPPGLALAGFPAPWLATSLAAAGLLALFACVWLVAHSVNILILLSPSATLDILMRGFRSSVLAVLTVSSLLSPWLGLLAAVAIAFLAVRCFGWAWRLTAMGSTVALDWLSRRKPATPVPGDRVRAFLARARDNLPARTRGTFGPDATGNLVFRGRPLPWLPARSLQVPAAGTRLIRSFPGPAVVVPLPSRRPARWLTLPPRYQGSESSLGSALGLEFDTEHPVARNLRAAIDWLRDTVSSQARPEART